MQLLQPANPGSVDPNKDQDGNVGSHRCLLHPSLPERLLPGSGHG